MAFVTDIVPDDILFDPKQGTIQYHPSLLPKYRGLNTHARALEAGDSEHQ